MKYAYLTVQNTFKSFNFSVCHISSYFHLLENGSRKLKMLHIEDIWHSITFIKLNKISLFRTFYDFFYRYHCNGVNFHGYLIGLKDM